MYSSELVDAARHLLGRCRDRKVVLATAESCTGGLIAGLLTEIAGSSDVVECGFVTYSNAAKTRMLGVPADLIAAHGAVSEEVARAMVTGALARSDADVAVAVTGVAGPGGGSAEKPVGLVHIAVGLAGERVLHQRCLFAGMDRSGVRLKTVETALAMLEDALG